MGNQQTDKNSTEDKSVLDSIKMSRIILPVLIGIGIVIYMMTKQLDVEEFKAINWNGHALLWIFLAIMMYVLRHFFYAARLRLMSDRVFDWRKSIQLIFIWEFASAVSPTSVGGSGVALFLLAQEKLSAAKTVSIVIYSMVLDSIFFIVSLPILYFFLGPIMIRPDMVSITDLDGFGYTFISVLAFMTLYASIFYYGLFINPVSIKRLLLLISKFPLLKRFKRDLRQTAMDVVTTSEKLKIKPKSFHITALTHTFGAWITRFLAISCIIIAFVPDTPMDLINQMVLYARSETMHVVTAFTPTPGGAGFAEYLFGGFYTDYLSKGISSLVALIWRVITYYPYLIAGVIIIPLWIRDVINRRRGGDL